MSWACGGTVRGGVWSDWRPPWSVWGLFECVFAHFRGGVGRRGLGLGRVGACRGGGWWGCVGVGVWVVWGLRRGGLLVRGCAVWVSGLVFLVRLSVG